MHILLVDDVQDTRQLFSMAFMLAGHRTSTASSGAEALDLVMNRRFDAVLLDLEMPTMDGWKVLESIRQIPGGDHVPIVMFSAYHDEEKEQRALEAGAYALLRKPMLPQFVISVLDSAIENKAAQA